MSTLRSSLVLAALLWPGALGLAASAPGPGWVERSRYLMGTRCDARAYGDPGRIGPALDAALERIAEVEDALTTWREDGALARLNASFARATGSAVAVGADLLAALDEALAWAERTGGRFDPTVGALTDAWGLRDGGRVPDEVSLEGARALVSWRLVELDTAAGTARYRRPGVRVDLGGFGKGYALDRAAETLLARGVSDALLDFGGQVLALGAPPDAEGWVVELADPGDRARPVAALLVRDASVATSGNSERAFVVAGKRHGHVIDPRSGLALDRDGAATVLARGAAEADALSTALFVAGPAAALDVLPAGAGYVYLEPVAEDPPALRGFASSALRPRLAADERIRWSWTVLRSEPGKGIGE